MLKFSVHYKNTLIVGTDLIFTTRLLAAGDTFIPPSYKVRKTKMGEIT
jgi:hypothetical protein